MSFKEAAKKIIQNRKLAGAMLAVVLASCSVKPVSQSVFAFGTVCTIRIYEKKSAAPAVPGAVFERLTRIERLFSPTIPESALSAINRNAGVAPVPVESEVIVVLKTALRIAEQTGGAFDPSIYPLVKLWGIGTDNERIPSGPETAAALALVDWRRVQIRENTVFLETPGMALDLGGIVKGYAADEAARILQEAGVRRAIIDFGGNIAALGQKRGGGLFPRDEPWRVGIQNPAEKRGVYAAVIPCANATLVTSGIYERYFEQDGRRYHHILSAKTGRPVDNELASVTIITPLAGLPGFAGGLNGAPASASASLSGYDSMTADALSTALFALGREEGLSFLRENYPRASAVFILKTGLVLTGSSGQ